MTRPGPLYDRLGVTVGELLTAFVGNINVSDQITSLSIRRGGTGLTGHTPAVATLNTTAVINLAAGSSVQARINPEGIVQDIADKAYTSWDQIVERWHGRLATQGLHDHGLYRRGSTVTSSAWSALLRQSPETWTPVAGPFSAGLAALCDPPWGVGAIIQPPAWIGDSDQWPAPEAGKTPDPITAAQYLQLLDDHLYHVTDRRDGPLWVTAANALTTQINNAAVNAWPLARAHVEAPITWHQPAEWPTRYRARITLPDGTQPTKSYGTSDLKTHTFDWRDTIASTEQWQRINGLRYEALGSRWQLPKLNVRVDHLISSRHESHRRAAGMVLALNVGDAVPLAGDWPTSITGMYLVAGLDETITPNGWSIQLTLVPSRFLVGATSPAVKPRTWDQTTQTWDTPTTQTWNEGVTS